MKFIDYIKDKVFFILVNLILFLILFLCFFYTQINFVVVVILFLTWFLPLFFYILLEYIKLKKYYLEIENILESLDKKYLLPELLKTKGFLEADILNNILKVVSRDMHENINVYKNKQIDYREYIETWVHEIKTPIASTKLIIENDKNDTTEKINQQINKIENFVEQVLYYSKSDNVKDDYKIKEVNLEESVKNVIKKNYKDFINKKIKLKLKEINETVYTDTKWIEFILNQILINSIKYSKINNPIIKIYSCSKENSVVLVIEDNGVGICENDVEKVFNKGFTGENGRIFGQSTGMGLYICKKLSIKLGINMKLESKINEGTKVSIIIPKTKI